jgi:hypothetical protein
MKKQNFDSIDWVKLAIPKKETRAFLLGLNVREDRIEATDGKRMHLAPNQSKLPVGLWGENMTKIDAVFPDTTAYIPSDPQYNFALIDSQIYEAMAVCQAAIAYGKATGKTYDDSIRIFFGRSCFYFKAQYMLDILKGANEIWPVWIAVRKPSQMVWFCIGNGYRNAGLMPLVPTCEPKELKNLHWRFDLSKCFEPFQMEQKKTETQEEPTAATA